MTILNGDGHIDLFCNRVKNIQIIKTNNFAPSHGNGDCSVLVFVFMLCCLLYMEAFNWYDIVYMELYFETIAESFSNKINKL